MQKLISDEKKTKTCENSMKNKSIQNGYFKRKKLNKAIGQLPLKMGKGKINYTKKPQRTIKQYSTIKQYLLAISYF